MTEPIRVGVIGYGLAGRIFHAAVISATPGLQLACVVQRSGDEAAAKYPGVRIARSVEEMLGDTGIRLVVVATPSHSHHDIAKHCLRENRDVVIDKPFTLTSEQAADLIRLAHERKRMLTVYQNRRWDGDFKTVRQILSSGELGRLVVFESHIDRFRPESKHDTWRESGGTGSGILFDLAPHLIDQATALFGTPRKIFATVRMDRDDAATDDAFDIFLTYDRERELTAILRSTATARIPGPRFTLNGTRGSYVKFGPDPQEDQLKAGMTFDSPGFGEDPEAEWGILRVREDAPKRIPTQRGDYRGYYENVRDALLGKAPLAVTAQDAWRTTRLIELARQSSSEGRVLRVDLPAHP